MTSYNIHNLVGIDLQKSCRYAEKKLKFFESSSLPQQKITVLGSGRPYDAWFYKKIGKFFVKKNSIFCRDRRKLSFFSVWIENLDYDETTIHFSGDPLFSGIMLLHGLIEPIMMYKISKAGALLLHGSSFELDKKGYVLAGKHGTGKTEKLIQFLNQGALYLSDDLTIIKDGEILAYPLPMGIRLHHAKILKVSRGIKARLFLENLINRATMGYSNLVYFVPAKNIGFRSKLKSIQILGSSDEGLFAELLEGNDDRLFSWTIFGEYVKAYREVNCDFDFWRYFKPLLKKLVDEIENDS